MDATLCLNTSGRPYYGEGAAEGEAHIIGTGNVNFFTTQTGF